MVRALDNFPPSRRSSPPPGPFPSRLTLRGGLNDVGNSPDTERRVWKTWVFVICCVSITSVHIQFITLCNVHATAHKLTITFSFLTLHALKLCGLVVGPSHIKLVIYTLCLATIFPNEQISNQFETNCQPIKDMLGYRKIGFDAPQNLPTRKYVFEKSHIKLLLVTWRCLKHKSSCYSPFWTR